jgi:tRNA threonylcarbamoyladenosine biosynthesis protein TsaB
MLILALDTTTRAGSVAIVRDGVVLDVLVGDGARDHADRLPSDVQRLLGANGLALRDVDLFGVAAGPGSFTGLRIGIATIQGLAFANSRSVVAVSALEATASTVLGTDGAPIGSAVGVWMDAHRGEVFSAVYSRAGRGGDMGDSPSQAVAPSVIELTPASVASPELTLARWRGYEWANGLCLAGDGAVRYRAVADAAPELGWRSGVEVRPLAPAVALLAERRAAEGGATLPHAVRAVYVRRPDAELARDKRRTP